MAEKANGLTCGGLKVDEKPEMPQIEWKDGIINDETELMDIEERKLNAGLTSKVESLMRMEGINRKQAEARITRFLFQRIEPQVLHRAGQVGGQRFEERALGRMRLEL